MDDVFIGSAALASGGLTRGRLRWNYRAIKASDALALADRYTGARGLRRLNTAIQLMDAGAQSPKESQLRLVLIDAGLPAPRTQIRVSDGSKVAFIDMGYDEPMVGLDYDGDQHQTERDRYMCMISGATS
jgi:hypothetical protein